MLTPIGHWKEQMANIQKHLVYSIHTPATQAWKEIQSLHGKSTPQGQAGGIQNKLAGFKAGKFVAARLTGIGCHFSWPPPWQRSSPWRGEVLELKPGF